jgi:hypothetical protein
MRFAALVLAAIVGVFPRPMLAQDEEQQDEKDKAKLNRVWQIDRFKTGFCIQLLVDPVKLELDITRNARVLKAEAMEDLSPVLKTVVGNQPELGSWTPSNICLYFMERVDVGSLMVSEKDPAKIPMIGVWTLAAADAAGGARKDVVLRVFTNSGRLERAGQVGGLDIRTIRTVIRPIENEDDPNAPPLGTLYQLRFGKTLLTWSGRQASDSTPAGRPQVTQWRADSKRRGALTARLSLTPEWIQPMVGSLRIEGEDDFAEAVKASPIRFVGPAMLGGAGELAFGR